MGLRYKMDIIEGIFSIILIMLFLFVLQEAESSTEKRDPDNSIIFSCPDPEDDRADELWLVTPDTTGKWAVGHPDTLLGFPKALEMFVEIQNGPHNVYYDPQCNNRYKDFFLAYWIF